MICDVSVTSQVFAFTLKVIPISRPLTVITRPLTELSGPLTELRRPLTASKMLGRIREGRYLSALHIASPAPFTLHHWQPFTASHCRATYYSVGEGFPDL